VTAREAQSDEERAQALGAEIAQRIEVSVSGGPWRRVPGTLLGDESTGLIRAAIAAVRDAERKECATRLTRWFAKTATRDEAVGTPIDKWKAEALDAVDPPND